MTSLVTEKATKKNVWQILKSSPYLQRSLVLDSGHLLVQVPKRSDILQGIAHKELGTTLQSKCCWNLQKVDILLSVQRLTPLSRGILKSKGHGKLSMHFAAGELTIATIFRIIISVNQLSIYGAVAAICEEFENHQDGSGEPEILMGQSIVLSEKR